MSTSGTCDGSDGNRRRRGPASFREAGRGIEAQYRATRLVVARRITEAGGGLQGFNREIAGPWLAAGEQRSRIEGPVP